MSYPKQATEFLNKAGVRLTKDITAALQIAYEEGKGYNDPIINYEVYDKFKERMKNRFKQNGLIRTGEAWELARGVAMYGSLCNMMRFHMEEMERKGTATKIRRGVWIIQHHKS